MTAFTIRALSLGGGATIFPWVYRAAHEVAIGPVHMVIEIAQSFKLLEYGYAVCWEWRRHAPTIRIPGAVSHRPSAIGSHRLSS
jgi:hypothetical protein